MLLYMDDLNRLSVLSQLVQLIYHYSLCLSTENLGKDNFLLFDRYGKEC